MTHHIGDQAILWVGLCQQQADGGEHGAHVERGLPCALGRHVEDVKADAALCRRGSGGEHAPVGTEGRAPALGRALEPCRPAALDWLCTPTRPPPASIGPSLRLRPCTRPPASMLGW